MNDEGTLVKQSYQLIRKDLGLEEDWPFKTSEFTADRLEQFLTRQIDHLLDSNFNVLLNALYRIDISESAVKKILSEAKPGEIANLLAKAVIDREKQKVITRLKYRSL